MDTGDDSGSAGVFAWFQEQADADSELREVGAGPTVATTVNNCKACAGAPCGAAPTALLSLVLSPSRTMAIHPAPNAQNIRSTVRELEQASRALETKLAQVHQIKAVERLLLAGAGGDVKRGGAGRHAHDPETEQVPSWLLLETRRLCPPYHSVHTHFRSLQHTAPQQRAACWPRPAPCSRSSRATMRDCVNSRLPTASTGWGSGWLETEKQRLLMVVPLTTPHHLALRYHAHWRNVTQQICYLSSLLVYLESGKLITLDQLQDFLKGGRGE